MSKYMISSRMSNLNFTEVVESLAIKNGKIKYRISMSCCRAMDATVTNA